MTIRKAAAVLGLVFALAPAPRAAAQGDGPPEERTEAGIRYRSGGVGSEEREALLAVSATYNLKLTFAAKDTAFMDSVEVRIEDAAGKSVLEATSRGPWLFAKLPPGRYRVKATQRGKTLEQSGNVGTSGQAQLNYYWD